MKYLKSSKHVDPYGERRDPDEEVDEAYVERYASLETRRWFENLGGREEMRKHRDGRIYVRSVSPDETEIRETIFTPIRDEQS